MWVRSKNKEVLADIKAFGIVEIMNKIRLIGYSCAGNIEYICLGEYKTMEKVMSILDDLQCRIGRSESDVFQMPEDDDE